MKRNIPEETLDAILTDKMFFKMKTNEVAEKHGLSRAFVNATCTTFSRVQEGRWDEVKFMLEGGQMTMKTVEWAAKRCGVQIPVFQKEEPKTEEEKPLDGQLTFPEFIKLDKTTCKTIWALIDALEKNAMECGRLADAMRK